jgi:hypothetical protein
MNRQEKPCALQIGEEFQHLRAHRHVERRDRLVGDHEFRPAHHGAGDRHALALAARKLMRIALGEAGAQADFLSTSRRAPSSRPVHARAPAAAASPTSSPMVMRGSSEE